MTIYFFSEHFVIINVKKSKESKKSDLNQKNRFIWFKADFFYFYAFFPFTITKFSLKK